VEQELITLPEHLNSPPIFSGVRITRSLVLCVYFVDRCLSYCYISFGHCVVSSSSIYGFWLSLWYLQTLVKKVTRRVSHVVQQLLTLAEHWRWPHVLVGLCCLIFSFLCSSLYILYDSNTMTMQTVFAMSGHISQGVIILVCVVEPMLMNKKRTIVSEKMRSL
jgi:hypothetical protein